MGSGILSVHKGLKQPDTPPFERSGTAKYFRHVVPTPYYEVLKCLCT